MKQAGQVVLFRFPQTDLTAGKLRPALMLSELPGGRADWLICMISSQMHQYVKDFDEIIKDDDVDFQHSGLKVASEVRVGRLAVVESGVLLGTTGEIENERLHRIKDRLANWIHQR